MLRKLTIENYALIDRLDMEFPAGLSVITGETGAGKSIMLGALSLILGGKADSSVLRDPDRKCIVEAEFSCAESATSEKSPLLLLEREGFDISGGDLILRRVISPAGRSRSFINDEPASAALLSELSRMLLDVHSQHAHLFLSDAMFQRELLDIYSGISSKVCGHASLYRRKVQLVSELEGIRKEARAWNEESEYRKYRYEQLAGASLRDGELEEAEAEYDRLAHSEDIRRELNSVSSCLSEHSVVRMMKDISHSLDKVTSYGIDCSELSGRFDACKIELQDLTSEIETLAESVDVSPGRMEELEERISRIRELMRRFSAGTESELISMRDELAVQMDMGYDFSERERRISEEIADLESSMHVLASEIRSARTVSAPELSSKLTSMLSDMEMPFSRVEFSLSPLSSPDPYGEDSVEMLFSSNAGSPMQSVSKVASGGEMSRLSLAVKSVMASFVGMPTMIFDEIDTGVSGKVADRMGNLVASMGKHMQIISITHLPQMASKGENHFLVSKTFDGNGRAQSCIRRISGRERVMEIARMLSGSSITEAAVCNAEELLGR